MTTGGWITLAVFLALLLYQWHRTDRLATQLHEDREEARLIRRRMEDEHADDWREATARVRDERNVACLERDAARTALAEVLRELAASTPTEDART